MTSAIIQAHHVKIAITVVRADIRDVMGYERTDEIDVAVGIVVAHFEMTHTVQKAGNEGECMS